MTELQTQTTWQQQTRSDIMKLGDVANASLMQLKFIFFHNSFSNSQWFELWCCFFFFLNQSIHYRISCFITLSVFLSLSFCHSFICMWVNSSICLSNPHSFSNLSFFWFLLLCQLHIGRRNHKWDLFNISDGSEIKWRLELMSKFSPEKRTNTCLLWSVRRVLYCAQICNGTKICNQVRDLDSTAQAH